MRRTHVILNLISIAIICVLFVPALSTYSLAYSDIYLSLSGPETEVHTGDVVNITVSASRLEHITRFGPIDLACNSNDVEYISVWPTTELSAFTYTVDESTPGHFKVTAVDQAVEADIAANQLSGEFDDPSVDIDSEVVLFTISFRITSATRSNIRFWLEQAGGFRDSSMDEFSASVGDGITVQVNESLSDDASLSLLASPDFNLTPEFSPDIYEYTVSVNRDVHDIAIDAVPGNTWSTIEIDGNENLQFGENRVHINVTAQDGVTVRQYTIYVTRQEDAVYGGTNFVDAFGKIYTFLDFPAIYDIPDGFQEETRVINGYNVNVLAREGLSSVLVYAYDGTNEPTFFFYNPITKITTKYSSNNFVIMPSRVLTVAAVPSIVKVPDGFHSETIIVEGVEIDGFMNDDGVFIAYMKDEEGNAEFYRYDETSGRFVDYKSVDRTAEKVYKMLFHIFIIISIVEAVLVIVIVCVIRKVVLSRARPKPRRV